MQEQIIPASDPKQCGESERIIYCVDDDVNVNADVDATMMIMLSMMMTRMMKIIRR